MKWNLVSILELNNTNKFIGTLSTAQQTFDISFVEPILITSLPCRLVAPFLTLTPDLCLVIEDDDECTAGEGADAEGDDGVDKVDGVPENVLRLNGKSNVELIPVIITSVLFKISTRLVNVVT